MFKLKLFICIFVVIMIFSFAIVVKSKIMYNNLCEDIERGYHANRKI